MDTKRHSLDNPRSPWHFRFVSEKFQQLRDLIRSYGSCLVAYSGGVDSAFLALVAHQELGSKSLAAIADSPSLPRRELEEALDISRQFGFPIRVVRTKEFENPLYLSNPSNRCYYCKHELFTELEPLARAEGFAVIAYGENASDIGDFRPGAKAATEFQVRAPLKEASLTKDDIRRFSTELGLPTAQKAQMACLSSRIPYGESVTPEKLKMIEQAENILRDLGFYEVRVRHHVLSAAPVAQASRLRVDGASSPRSDAGDETSPELAGETPALHLARIEVGVSELSRLSDDKLSSRISEALKAIGYTYVTVDLRGYRRGSLNMSPTR